MESWPWRTLGCRSNHRESWSWSTLGYRSNHRESCCCIYRKGKWALGSKSQHRGGWGRTAFRSLVPDYIVSSQWVMIKWYFAYRSVDNKHSGTDKIMQNSISFKPKERHGQGEISSAQLCYVLRVIKLWTLKILWKGILFIMGSDTHDSFLFTAIIQSCHFF